MVIKVRRARRVVINSGNVRAIYMDYKAENATDVKLFADDYEMVRGVDYSVDGIGEDAISAHLTNPGAWSAYSRFAMFVHYPVNQPTDMDLGGPFGRRFEDALDRMGFALQTLEEQVERAPKLEVATPVERRLTIEQPQGGMFLRYSDDGEHIIPSLGPEGAGGPAGLPDAPMNGNFYQRRDGLWEVAPRVPERLTQYMDPDTLRDIGVNMTPLVGGGFPRSASEEIVDAFSGGSVANALPNLAAADVATCYITPPTEDSTNFVATTTPFREFAGETIRMVPVDIRTSFVNTPVSIPLFKPVMVNGFGFLVWQYIGGEPIHTILEGGITCMIRVGRNIDDALVRHTLRLYGFNLPQLELGQSGGKRNLATSAAAFDVKTRLASYAEFQDDCGPITPAARTAAAGFANLFVGYDNGAIVTGSTTDTLETAGHGPEVRTTKWMDVSAYDMQIMAFLLDNVGVSTLGRMQARFADGTIKYVTNMGRNYSAEKIWRVPIGATACRITYSTDGDAPLTPTFRALGGTQSGELDPLKGYWVQRSFNVNRDVTFWPGSQYALGFLTEIIDGEGSAREWGFRYQSGGLRFRFEAGRIRKTIAQTFFNEE